MEVFTHFMDGTALGTGLTPTVDIYNVTDGTVLVTGGVMTEIAMGSYVRSATFEDGKSYAIIADGGASLPNSQRFAVAFYGTGEYVCAFFTYLRAPKTGLLPVVTIYDQTGTLVVDAAAMTEVGGGFYKYNFTGYDESKQYVAICDGGVAQKPIERYVTGSTVAFTATVESTGAAIGFPGRMMREKITWWKRLSQDGFGKSTFEDPVVCKGRWQEQGEMITDTVGKQIFSTAQVFIISSKDIDEGDYVYRGISSASDPTQVTGAWEVKRALRTQGIRNYRKLRKGWL